MGRFDVVYFIRAPFLRAVDGDKAVGLKTSGAMLKRFLADDSVWNPAPGESWYYDDAFFDIQDGVRRDGMDAAFDRYGDSLERLPDETVVVIESGDICWQGQASPRDKPKSQPLIDRFLQWEKAQSVRVLVAVFEVPKNIDETALAELGQKMRDLGAVSIRGLPDQERIQVRVKPS